jgi:hypothetical protein
MEKIIVGVLAGAVPADAIKAVRAMLDFIYYAQFQPHTDATLAAMESSLREFHTYKHIFIRLGICKDFNIYTEVPLPHALRLHDTASRLC